MQEQKMIKLNEKGNPDIITREYLDSLAFEERLIGSSVPSTITTLFNCQLTAPIMTTAVSGLHRYTENGTSKMADAMKQFGSIFWMGISEDDEVESAVATGANVIEIIKPYADHQKVYTKLEHGKKSGLVALGMDIDHCFAQDGTFGTDRHGNPMQPKSVSDIRGYVDACEGIPFIAKGILSVQDAVAAAEAGVSAIVLSHHHGICHFAIPPLLILADIRKAVGKSMIIIVDSCLKDGYDAYKALALGADGVGFGRTLLEPLHNRGSKGVFDYMSTVNQQLKSIMGRTGVANIQNFDASVIHRIR